MKWNIFDHASKSVLKLSPVMKYVVLFSIVFSFRVLDMHGLSIYVLLKAG